MLRVPVISSVGHHTDRTLIDDVAAVACSTPTHAAEAAVPIDCTVARAELTRAAGRLHVHATRAVLVRARVLAQLSRAPGRHVARHRRHLHQLVRELRASARRTCETGDSLAATHLKVLSRRAGATRLEVERALPAIAGRGTRLHAVGESAVSRRARDLDRLALALAGHDPQRTLERGYALVTGRDGSLVGSAAAAREAGSLDVRFHDGLVPARVEGG
jgi:exodeoxyribonuclease VII large subunit